MLSREGFAGLTIRMVAARRGRRRDRLYLLLLQRASGRRGVLAPVGRHPRAGQRLPGHRHPRGRRPTPHRTAGRRRAGTRRRGDQRAAGQGSRRRASTVADRIGDQPAALDALGPDCDPRWSARWSCSTPGRWCARAWVMRRINRSPTCWRNRPPVRPERVGLAVHGSRPQRDAGGFTLDERGAGRRDLGRSGTRSRPRPNASIGTGPVCCRNCGWCRPASSCSPVCCSPCRSTTVRGSAPAVRWCILRR